MGKKAQTIGFRYYLGAHLIVCHGPVDEVQAIIVGERVAWAGERYASAPHPVLGGGHLVWAPTGVVGPVTASEQIFVNAPELFGGAKKEGGVQGYVDVMMGEPTQGANDYLVSKLGTPMPGFRGVLSLVLRQCYVSAMSPYPKPWAVRVKRIPGRSWYEAKADINNGSANPVHVIYEALTNGDWGMGYPTGSIDEASFIAAADQCYAEELGLSFQLSKQDSIESFIYTILGHCNGLIYTRPEDGKFSIKLLRDDYDPEELDTFDESNITALEFFERPGYAEMINEIVVIYRPRGTSEDDSVTVQDLAAVQAQLGVVSQTKNYPGIDHPRNAARIAQRDLRQTSTPLARVKFRCKRTAWNKRLGDVINFNWEEHGLEGITLRILGLNYGNLTSGEITVDAAEDIFGLPSSTYIGDQPPLWTDPNQTPVAFTVRRVEEVSYWDACQAIDPADLAEVDPLACTILTVMGEPSQYLQGYELWTKPNGGEYTYETNGQPVTHGLLNASIGKTDTSITVSSLSSGAASVAVGSLVGIDNELMRLDAFNPATGVATVARGCIDTVPAAHTAGARVFFMGEERTFGQTQYAPGETVYVKALPRTASAVLPIASAPEDIKVMVGRFGRPYPPGKVRVNASVAPAPISGTISVSWAHRDKEVQADTIVDTEAASIGPPADVRYVLQFFNALNTLLIEKQNVSGDSATAVLAYTGNVRMVLYSINDVDESWQRHEVFFDYTPPPGTVVSVITSGTWTPAEYILDGGGA